MYSACKNRGTAWDLLKFATSKEQDGKLPARPPARCRCAPTCPRTYPEYFDKHAEYKTFADQASRIVEVPNVANSVTIWQTFRDAYSKSVIFGKEDPKTALSGRGHEDRVAGAKEGS